MNFKRCTAVLLCAAMLTTGGIFSTVVSAADNSSSIVQTASSTIVDSEGKIIGVFGDADYFVDGSLNSAGKLMKNSYEATILTNIRFKIALNSKYGKIKSSSVVLYDGNGGKTVLTKDKNKYYLADTTRPMNYKLVIVIKTVEGKTYKRSIQINNKKLKYDGYATSTVDGKIGVYNITNISNVGDIYRMSNNCLIPSGSAMDMSAVRYDGLTVEIAKYSDYMKNGSNADWKNIEDLVNGDYYIWKTGEYTLRYYIVDKDNSDRKLEIVMAPKIKVVPLVKEVDLKNVYQQLVNNNILKPDEIFDEGEVTWKDKLSTLVDPWGSWVSDWYHDNQYLFNYKNDLSYNNIINVSALANISASKEDNVVYYENFEYIFNGFYNFGAKTYAAGDSPIYNWDLFYGDIDVEDTFKMYYYKGEVNDDIEIKWKLFTGSEGTSTSISDMLAAFNTERYNKYKTLRDKYQKLYEKYNTQKYETLYEKYKDLVENFDEVELFSFKIKYKDGSGTLRSFTVKNVPVCGAIDY